MRAAGIACFGPTAAECFGPGGVFVGWVTQSPTTSQVLTIKLVERKGGLAGALIVRGDDRAVGRPGAGQLLRALVCDGPLAQI